MRKVQGVSVPRSGHHLLQSYLTHYFSRDPHYLDDPKRYVQDGYIRVGKWSYCEYYAHCRQSPCRDPSTLFQKTHDFTLDVPYRADQWYLVQTRQPLPAIISHYRLAIARGLRKDSRFQWWRFFHSQLAYWKQFQAKWVSPNYPNVLVLHYDDLVTDPNKAVRETLSFIAPDDTVDEDWLRQLVAARETYNRKSEVSQFKYYKPSYERKADSAMQQVHHRDAA